MTQHPFNIRTAALMACITVVLVGSDARAEDRAGICVAPRYEGKHLYVSPTGDDVNPGTAERPFKTYEKAVLQAEPGTTVHLLPPTVPVYVSPSGNDADPGTFQQPKKNLQQAILAAKSGTVVHLLPGTYPPMSIEGLQGEEQNPIIVRGPAPPPVDYSTLDALSAQNLRIEPIRQALAGGRFALTSTDGLAVIEAAGADRGIALRGCRGLIFENLVIQNAKVNFHVSESHHITLRDAVVRETRKEKVDYSAGVHLARLTAVRAGHVGRNRPDEQSGDFRLERVTSYGHFGEGFWVDLDAVVDVEFDRCVSHDNGHGQPAPSSLVNNRSGFIYRFSPRFYPRHRFTRCASLNNIADGFDLGRGIGGLVLEYCVADGNGRWGPPFVNLRVSGGVGEGHVFHNCCATAPVALEGGTHRTDGLIIQQTDPPPGGQSAVTLAARVPLLAPASTAGAAAGQIRFEDVTAKVGLESSLTNWHLAHSASWGDLTGNGFPDLYVGAFASQPRWQDGPIPNMLFLNAEGRRFTLSPQKELRMEGLHARPSHVLLADLDQDGDLDMVVACHASRAEMFQSTVWENCGGGKFRNVTPKRGYWPSPMGYRNVAAVDLNGDGLLDLVACDNNYSNWRDGKGSLLILINKGGFEFEDGRERYGFPVAGTTGFGLAIGDVNEDGRPDFFVADCNRLFVSGPDGRYQEAQAGVFLKPQGRDQESRTCGAVFGDLNGDGLLDLVTTEHGGQSQSRVYLNEGISDGVPRFRDVTREAGLEGPMPNKGITGFGIKGAQVAAVDLDNDGRKDIWLAVVWRDDAGRLQPVVMRNLGNDAKGVPRFSSIPRDRLVGYYAAAPLADFDRDGRVDCFMAAWADWNETPSILFRNVTEGGSWVTVRVKGDGRWNTMGIGAVVRVYEAGRAGDPQGLIQRQDITVGNGYASGEEALAHLGVGRRDRVDVEIRWNGQTRVLPRQPVNRILTVEWKAERGTP